MYKCMRARVRVYSYMYINILHILLACASAMQRDERNKSAFHGNNGTYPFAIKPRYCNFLLGSSVKAFATRFPALRQFFSLGTIF